MLNDSDVMKCLQTAPSPPLWHFNYISLEDVCDIWYTLKRSLKMKGSLSLLKPRQSPLVYLMLLRAKEYARLFMFEALSKSDLFE